MRGLIAEHDAVVSALPYFLNKKIAQITYDLGKHYFDLTEDLETTNFIRELSKTSKGVMVGKDARAKNIGGELICKVW